MADPDAPRLPGAATRPEPLRPPVERLPEPEEGQGEVRLAREITLVDATLLGVGALMGGGVFVLLGIAAGVAGNGVIVALFLNGFITLPTLLVYAELGSASDDAGGGYLWVRQGLGNALGFLGGWLGWFSHVIACALYTLASSYFILTLLQFAGWLHSPWPVYAFGPQLHLGGLTIQLSVSLVQGLALVIGVAFVMLNYVGVKVGIKAENVVNTLVLVVVLVFIGFGIWGVSQHTDQVAANFTPFWKDPGVVGNMSNIFLAMGITFIAFEGYEIISQTSEEIQNPRRNIPRAIFYSFLIVWAIMMAVAFIALGLTRSPLGGVACAQAWQCLGGLGDQSALALILMSDNVMRYGTIIIAGSALLLQVTALNATIYSSSRVSFAMGRDHNLPKFFGKVHPKRRTPHYAVLGSGVLILIMTLLPIGTVAVSADVMFLLLFLFVNLAYIKLHKTIPQERFGFKAPLFPYIPLIGIFTKFFLAIYLWKHDHVAWYVTGAWIAVGMVVYYTYVRTRQTAPKPIGAIAPLPRPVVRGPRKDYRILALLSSPAPSTARSLARTAGAIAKALDGEVLLLQPILVPEVTPLSEGQRFLKDQSLLNEARRAVPSAVPVHATVRIGHNLDAMVRESVREEGISLLIMSGQARATVGQPTSPLLAYPPCDIAVLRLKTPDISAQNVLLTVQALEQAPLGIRLGTALAKSFGGHLTLFHVTTPTEVTDGSQASWGRTLLEHNAVAGVKTEISSEEGAVVRKVLDRSRGHDLVVVGASVARRPWRKNILGHRTQEIADRVAGNVLIVRSGGLGGPKGNILGRTLIQLRRYFLPE